MYAYRYGFNGKENDNEIKGFGNVQDYGMRVYDPRVGRFLSVDPLASKYPELSTYQFASNSPIANTDLDGLEAIISITKFSKNSNGTLIEISKEEGIRAIGQNKGIIEEYGNIDKYGMHGKLDIFKNLDDGQTFTKYSTTVLDDVKNFMGRIEKEVIVKGGIMEYAENGHNLENKVSPNAGKAMDIDDVVSAFDITKASASLPGKSLIEYIEQYHNAAQTGYSLIPVKDYFRNKVREIVDSSCIACHGTPTPGIPYVRFDKDHLPVDTVKNGEK